MKIWSVVPVLSYLNLVLCLENWPILNNTALVAQRAERDISRPIPITNITNYGVDLNTQIFDVQGYTISALLDVYNTLSVGIQLFFIDFYFNEYTSKWQLCPGPIPSNLTSQLDLLTEVNYNESSHICEPGLTIHEFMDVFHTFMTQTNSVLLADLLQLVVRLKKIDFDNNLTTTYDYTFSEEYLNISNSSLVESVSPLGSFLFTPLNLDEYHTSQENQLTVSTFYNDTSQFPTVETFMLTTVKRIFLNVIELNLNESSERGYELTDLDKLTVFLPNTSFSNSLQNNSVNLQSVCSNTINGGGSSFDYKNYNFITDTDDFPFNNQSLKDYLRCGYNPIITANRDLLVDEIPLSEKIDQFISWGYWSWAYGGSRHSLKNGSDIDVNDGNTTYVFRCVALYGDGFRLDDCFQKYPYACKNSSQLSEWKIDTPGRSYFDSYKDDICGDGFELAVPRLATDLTLLIKAMVDSNVGYPLWIDLNDITVNDCFVTGGPYADCPYFEVFTRSKLLKKIAPSFTIAGLILILVFLEKFFRINPIQTNRKTYWKRALNEYNEKHNYEGVPS